MTGVNSSPHAAIELCDCVKTYGKIQRRELDQPADPFREDDRPDRPQRLR